jgi:integrase
MSFRTQAQVDRLQLPQGRADAYFFDEECTGLSVRIQGRAKRWVVWYQANGKRRHATIGAVAGLPLKQARIEAVRIVGNARDGKDALADREAARARSADTLKALIDLYLEKRAMPRQRPRTYAEVSRYLLKRWEPLHDRPLNAITRHGIASRLEEIVAEHGPIAGNRARGYLGSAFAWAMKRGLVENNPVVGTEAPAEERRRNRVLSPAELTTAWKAAGDAGEFGLIVKLLMLTGQRREEVASMAWAEIDQDRALWTIPAARAKNAREHEVPLSRQALALLPEKREGRAFLFGRGRKGGFSGYSRAKARLDAAAGLKVPWILHDIRRSVVTHMNEIGVNPHVIEAVVNHVSGSRGGIAGRYNFAAYREQKGAALQTWADWLECVVEGREPSGNVVTLRR